MGSGDSLAELERSTHAGSQLKPGSPEEGPAATAMWLFDGKTAKLPGGFDTGELSPNSPVAVLQSFPQARRRPRALPVPAPHLVPRCLGFSAP